MCRVCMHVCMYVCVFCGWDSCVIYVCVNVCLYRQIDRQISTSGFPFFCELVPRHWCLQPMMRCRLEACGRRSSVARSVCGVGLDRQFLGEIDQELAPACFDAPRAEPRLHLCKLKSYPKPQTQNPTHQTIGFWSSTRSPAQALGFHDRILIIPTRSLVWGLEIRV